MNRQKQNFMKIPVNRIWALILLDVMSVLIASFMALYIRFDFSFHKMDKVILARMGHILIPNILFTLLFYAIWKLYKSVWRFASANELINIVLAALCTTIAKVIYCQVTASGNAQRLSHSLLLPVDTYDLLR